MFGQHLQLKSGPILISDSLTLTNRLWKSFRKSSLVRNLGTILQLSDDQLHGKLKQMGKNFPLSDLAPECGNHLGNVWLMPFFSPLPSINLHHASLPFQDSGWISFLPIPISFGSSSFHTIPTLCSHQFVLMIFSKLLCYK